MPEVGGALDVKNNLVRNADIRILDIKVEGSWVVDVCLRHRDSLGYCDGCDCNVLSLLLGGENGVAVGNFLAHFQ